MDLIGPFIDMSDNFVKIGHQLHEALEKVLYTMSSVTSFLLQRGFCLPEDIADEILEQESQEAIGGGGAGAGEAGENDVSEEFDKEDLEDPLEQIAGDGWFSLAVSLLSACRSAVLSLSSHHHLRTPYCYCGHSC